MHALTRDPARATADPPLRILQFGGGNFLRGYFDWMVDRMNERTGFDGGVVVVKPTASGDYAELRAQEGLFHVLLEGVQGGQHVRETRLVSCVHRVVHPYNDYAGFLRTAEEESIRYVVSNTTEAGIRFVAEDYPTGGCAAEFPGKLTQWLQRRWQEGLPGCHHLPLELIEENGQQLRQCVLRYARHWQLPEAFGKWVEQENMFYDTLVDRIVSGYPGNATERQQELGYRDQLLVAGEYYHSLVVQGPEEGIPGLPLAEAGINVTFTDDLRPYRERKVRLLNGAHTAIVPVGYLAGRETVGEVVDDAELLPYLQHLLYEEIIPTLDQPPGELTDFADSVLDRFRNPSIHHKLLDISLNSTTKFRTRLLPSLLAYHRKFGKLPAGIVRALAALMVFYRGKRGQEDIPLRDAADRLVFFRTVWDEMTTTRQVVERVLGREDWWGQDLNELPGLTAAVTTTIDQSEYE